MKLNIGNQVILFDTGRLEDEVEGGYTSVYEVLYSNLDEETGAFEYVTRAFPSVPNFTGIEPSEEYRKSIPRAGAVTRRHLNDMSIIRDDELYELRDLGVHVTIIPARFY